MNSRRLWYPAIVFFLCLLFLLPIRAFAREEFYLLCGEDMIPSSFVHRTPVVIYVSKPYGTDFVDSLLKEDAETRNVTFRLIVPPDMMAALLRVAHDEETAFFLLSAAEYDALKRDPGFDGLKLVVALPKHL